MKTIGIKLADGSFFPIMEDNHPAQKTLELTTAHNNQTKVMVDLYRSKSCSMDDAEYVDSLQIDNLVSHPNGEPSIAFAVSLDENSQLSANIRDPETGYESETAIPLVTRSEEELLVPDEYDISNIDDTDKKEPVKKGGLLSAADKIMENKKKTDLDEPIFGDDALPDFSTDTGIADIPHNDMFSTDAFLSSDDETVPETENTEKIEDNFFDDTEIPDFTSEHLDKPEEAAIFDDQALADFSDIPEKEEPTETAPDFSFEPEEPVAEQEETFDEPVEKEATVEEKNHIESESLDEPFESEHIEEPEDFDIPNESEPLGETEDFEEPVESEPLEEPEDFDIPDEAESEPETETDILPDFDQPLETDALDDFPDFDKEPEEVNSNDELEQSLAESKALNDIFSKDENEDPLPDFDDLDTGKSEFSDDNFFDLDNNITPASDNEEEIFGLPDDFTNFDDSDSDNESYISDIDKYPKASSPIDDFSIPDFPEDNSPSDFPDNFFDDFNDSPSSSADPLSFTGLYDKETEMGMSGMQNDEITKKTKGPVIICIICALICIIATALILLVKPKTDASNKINITKENQENIVLDNQSGTQGDVQIKVVEDSKPLPPPIPEAKEDEIVIIEQAEKVIPKQPEVIKENLNNISYQVIWGDTLWDIANTYYKNPWKYTDIAKYNSIKNPDHIISGTTLVIPAE